MSYETSNVAKARRTISVVGHGEATVEPDLALLSVAVETTATTAGEANSMNATKASRVVEAIKGLLTDEDSLKTTGYSLQPQYANRDPGSHTVPEIVGYIARNEVRARIHHLETVGPALDAALETGANRVNDLSFMIEDRTAQNHIALAHAGAEARTQAVSVAKALGVRLGSVISASTEALVPSPVRGEMAMSARAAGASTPIEPGEVKVRAKLFVTYGIVEKG